MNKKLKTSYTIFKISLGGFILLQKELGQLPMGFALALAKDEQSLMRFAEMTDDQRRDIINGTHNVTSKKEMNEYVSKIKTM